MNSPIAFKGFIPNEKLNAAAQRMLDRIMELAPSDAVCDASMLYNTRKYHLVLHVRSTCAKFDSCVALAQPFEALLAAADDVHEQIRRWKKSRWSEDKETGPPASES